MTKKYKHEHGNVVYIEKPLDFERALNRFKRKIKLSGIMKTLKECSYYIKPSLTKKRKKNLGKLKAYYKQKE